MPDLMQALSRAVPDVTAPVTLDGLEHEVEILRDPFGVPHVRARSAHDAYFAQGFVHAQDRLWQMQLDRMKAAGRAAEYLGPDAVTEDAFMRRLDLPTAAQADLEVLGDEARAMLDAYAAGVNAWIASMDAPPVELALLGADVEPWRAWDPAATLKVRHVLMGSMGPKLWRARLLRALDPEWLTKLGLAHGRDDLLIVPPGARAVWRADEAVLDTVIALSRSPDTDGSNSWGLHGSRTASGAPLLAGDPHRAVEAPGVYFQNRIACPDFDVIGFSMPGIPGMFHFGHNADVAWCITHAMADTQDLFLERDQDVLRRRTETIAVRGADPVTIEVARTANGPIVLGDLAAGTALSLRWTAIDRPTTTLGCIPSIMRARTVAELDEAMRGWVDPCNSLVMADVHGDVAYLHRGRVPVRHPANAIAPVPGWTGEHDWGDDVPFDELPRLRNPDGGAIVTANNRVIAPDAGPYLGTDYAAPNRAVRISERLAALQAATVADMESVHADRLSLSARALIEAVRDLAPADDASKRARDEVLAWDGTMDPGSSAAAIVATFRDELARTLLSREPLVRLTTDDPYPDEPDQTPAHRRVRGAAHVLASALTPDERTDAFVRSVVACDGRTWAEIHVTEVEHPLAASQPGVAALLNPPPVGMGGDGDCVNAGSADVGVGILHTSVARYVLDVGDWDASTWVVPLGTSGHPGSPHYADQSERWSRVQTIPMTYSWPAVERVAESRQTLGPT